MHRLTRLVGEAHDRQFGLGPLAIFEDIDRATVLAARRSGPGGGMCSEVDLGKRRQADYGWVERDDHTL